MNQNPRNAWSVGNVPRMFILEGPDGTLMGWRTYQVIQNGRTSTVMSKPLTHQTAQEKYAAKFYARGEWEDITKAVAPGIMPVPRPEIFAEIYGKQVEEKQQLALV